MMAALISENEASADVAVDGTGPVGFERVRVAPPTSMRMVPFTVRIAWVCARPTKAARKTPIRTTFLAMRIDERADNAVCALVPGGRTAM